MRKKLSATFSFVEIFSLDRRQVCVRELVAKELEQCGGVFTRCIRHDNLVNKKQNSKVRKNKQTNKQATTKTKHGYTRWNQEAKQDSVMHTGTYVRLIHYFFIKHAQMSAIFMGYLCRLKLRGSYMVCPITDVLKNLSPVWFVWKSLISKSGGETNKRYRYMKEF